MIRTVIFDIDDTMYDYTEGNRQGIQAVRQYCFREMGVSAEVFDQALKRSRQMRESVLGMDNAAVHSRLLRYQCMLELLGLPVFPHAAAMCELYWKTLLAGMKCMPGLKEFLQDLKRRGIQVGVGTNMTAYIQFKKLEQLNVTPWIGWMVTSEEAGAQKPNSRFYDYCCRKAGCRAEECLFIGDGLEGDIKGPLEYGMAAARYCPGREAVKNTDEVIPASHNAYMTIHSFEECMSESFWDRLKSL